MASHGPEMSTQQIHHSLPGAKRLRAWTRSYLAIAHIASIGYTVTRFGTLYRGRSTSQPAKNSAPHMQATDHL